MIYLYIYAILAIVIYNIRLIIDFGDLNKPIEVNDRTTAIMRRAMLTGFLWPIILLRVAFAVVSVVLAIPFFGYMLIGLIHQARQ